MLKQVLHDTFMISAVVLTRNKENAKKCLESLRWCDEVIVLEKDNLTDYAAQRNLGLEKAKNEWVLFVDDDEVVSEELGKEILETKIDPIGRFTPSRMTNVMLERSDSIIQKDPIGRFTPSRMTNVMLERSDSIIQKDPIGRFTPSRMTKEVDGYYIKRLDYFGGRLLKFGETGDIKLLRLGKKGAGCWQRKVHEFWDIKNTAILINPLYHYPHQTIKQFIDSINIYTNLDAQELNKENKNFSVFRLLFNPVGKFIQNYFIKLGFLDGVPGLVMAFMMSLHSLIVRVKQYESR